VLICVHSNYNTDVSTLMEPHAWVVHVGRRLLTHFILSFTQDIDLDHPYSPEVLLFDERESFSQSSTRAVLMLQLRAMRSEGIVSLIPFSFIGSRSKRQVYTLLIFAAVVGCC